MGSVESSVVSFLKSDEFAKITKEIINSDDAKRIYNKFEANVAAVTSRLGNVENEIKFLNNSLSHRISNSTETLHCMDKEIKHFSSRILSLTEKVLHIESEIKNFNNTITQRFFVLTDRQANLEKEIKMLTATNEKLRKQLKKDEDTSESSESEQRDSEDESKFDEVEYQFDEDESKFDDDNNKKSGIRQKGNIKFFNSRLDYGYIIQQNTKEEFYFKRDDIKNDSNGGRINLSQGRLVEFDLDLCNKPPKAINITCVNNNVFRRNRSNRRSKFRNARNRSRKNIQKNVSGSAQDLKKSEEKKDNFNAIYSNTAPSGFIQTTVFKLQKR